MAKLKAPFPYFGGKARVADQVWQRFGSVRNYVEPFAGSLACLLHRPQPFVGTETVNDMDGFISNFWRAVQAAPDDVARHADRPVNENDLHAIHVRMIEEKQTLVPRLEGDLDWYDAKIAGLWCFGLCCWIGGGWCSGDGPWQVVEVDGVRRLVKLGGAGAGVKRTRVDLGAGKGVNRTRVHLGNAGVGVHRSLVHLGNAGGESQARTDNLLAMFAALGDRLRNVRVCCGDWSRVCGEATTTSHGTTAVFLDPPYGAEDNRDANIYTVDSLTVATDVREWAIANGPNPAMRIALCGYDSFTMPAGWECVKWKTLGGYAGLGEGQGRENSKRERVWFSPGCESARTLFDAVTETE